MKPGRSLAEAACGRTTRFIAGALAVALVASACAVGAGPSPAPAAGGAVAEAEPGAASAGDDLRRADGAAAGTAAPGTPVTGERRSEAGSVTVVARWLAGAVPAARITMDTHSVDLDGFDLARLARARLDGGAWVQSSAWDAPKGGHHREGTVSFAGLDRTAFDGARTVELEIQNVAAPSRLLRWERAS